jgi:hypothetical protein
VFIRHSAPNAPPDQQASIEAATALVRANLVAVAESQRTIMRKPSCLISCTQPGPEGGRSARDGRQGSMNPEIRNMPGFLGPLRLTSTFPRPSRKRPRPSRHVSYY